MNKIPQKTIRLITRSVPSLLLIIVTLGIWKIQVAEGNKVLFSSSPVDYHWLLHCRVGEAFPREERAVPTMSANTTMFFKRILFSILLVALSMVYSFMMYLDDNNLFSIMGLLIIVVWIAVFMIYFVWSVYHYNINFGITDGEWKEIYKAKREAREFGMDLPSSGVREPTYNPYRSQTFGLPPGTVRGMIAFTLLFGGISLLISSMGNSEVDPNLLQLRIQQFEFFETAFLMMIAFYFGDRSLRYFRDRWKNPNGTPPGGGNPPGGGAPTPQMVGIQRKQAAAPDLFPLLGSLMR